MGGPAANNSSDFVCIANLPRQKAGLDLDFLLTLDRFASCISKSACMNRFILSSALYQAVLRQVSDAL